MGTDPRCPRCGSAMPVLFHVQRYCPEGCDKLPPGPPCPKCRSTVTEKFFTFAGNRMHCWPCGHVWNEQERPETD